MRFFLLVAVLFACQIAGCGATSHDLVVRERNSGIASGQDCEPGGERESGQAMDVAERFAGRLPKAWGQSLPGVVTRLPQKNGRGERPEVAVTLDACGGPKGNGFDRELVAFLEEKRIPASLFISGSWAKAHPEELRVLAANPLFRIEAHGLRHRPASVTGRSVYSIRGTASVSVLVEEVEGNARDLTAVTGKRPLWYRSGTAYYDDVAVDILHALGMQIAGYSIAVDAGAKLAADQVRQRVLAAVDGDILLAHMNHPESGTREGLRQGLTLLLARGFHFVPLP